ncbi:PQQ-binding-like beta-propeller repeat protein [Paenibacillus sp. RRE4]|uniref:outer membrane protein assembly factor BamB family protein n=1 Tax=Paenibacillus sp. RRE4 TaxID=2962587 RepID=UPI002881B11C|nr:PQQ-binding-like beta-propeller repeat protein [Paenibacillus sp. RRE4]MDT0126035.1 PQQ-binding-like beta-propeller repeat protein [Paenibacillus sp. RRE4]
MKKERNQSIWRYTCCVTLTGITVLLLTGCMTPDPQTYALGGQAQDSTIKATDMKAPIQVSDTIYNDLALPGSPTSLSAKQISAKLPYKKGEQVKLGEGLPLYSGRKDHRVAIDQMKITYLTIPKEKYTLTGVQGEWMQVKNQQQDSYWLPAWYALKQSDSITQTDPHTFTVRTGGKLYLTPDSTITWPSDQEILKSAFTVAEWKDWVGVSIAPRIWSKEWTGYHHALLWIKKRDVTGQTPVSDGWFVSEPSLPISMIRHLVDTKLNQTTTTKQVAKWLGEPDWKEQSRNLNEPGDPMRVRQTWRYERHDAHVLLTFNNNGKLTEIRWNMPASQDNEADLRSYERMGTFSYITQVAVGKSLPPTLSWKPDWVNQGDLNYTFLQAGTDDVLLMKGDDGGFSGMHYDDSYYALDRHTGKLLWRVHNGYGPAQAVLNTKRDAVTLYTSYDTDRKQYLDRVRHINLKDGKLLWEYKPQGQDKQNNDTNKKNTADDRVWLNGIKAARNVVIVDIPAAEGSSNGWIHVLNSSTGKRLWTKKLTTGYQLVNRNADEPCVLYQEKNQLVAADPLTGRTVWQVEAAPPAIELIENDSYFDGIHRYDPFASAPLGRWMLLEDQWVLLDLTSGKKRSQFPARTGQQLEVLNDGMVLIRENQKGDRYGDYGDYTTSLFDPNTGKIRWTVDAKIERGLREADQLYVIRNGYPASIDYRTGETRWDTQESVGANQYSTNQGSYLIIGDRLLLPRNEDLLVMDKKDGTLLGRVHDVVMGAPEHRDRDAKNGMVNRIDDMVYVGSANGRFRVLPADLLEGEISF